VSETLLSEFSAAQLAQAVSGRLVRGQAEQRFTKVCIDSRTAPANCLYVAIKGERFDGHRFLPDAAAKGAAGAIIRAGARRKFRVGRRLPLIEVEDTLQALGELANFLRRAHPVPLVGITGSNGKTTTKELLYAALTASKRAVLKSEGNFNNLVGVPLTLFRLDRAHQAAVIEMGMNSFGEIARLTEICEPDVGLITSVAAAHTEGLGSIEGVARAKGELFAGLSSSAVAVVNLDDEHIRHLPTPARRLTFSATEPQADVRGTLLADRGLEGLDFELEAAGERASVHLNLLGRHNLVNALGAAAAAHALGVSLAAIATGLGNYRPFSKRLQPTLAPEGYWVINDAYNANPASMAAGLRAAAGVAQATGGRLFAVLGEMLELGAVSEEAHRGVGRLCAELKAAVLAYLDTGSGRLYGEGAKAGGLREVVPGADHEEIASGLRRMLRPNDVVLVKGSRRTGMERAAELLLTPAEVRACACAPLP
jgi:UDP-N-acetylmuramoyl-tripeptide--D-alanyl-D-alanine ligase